MKALKVDLKKWNAEVFGDVGKKKKELLEGIKELECFEEARGLAGVFLVKALILLLLVKKK